MAKKSRAGAVSVDNGKIVKILEWTGGILFLVFAVFMLVAELISIFGVGKATLDMSRFVSIHYSGFNENAIAEVTVDKAGLERAMEIGYEEYETGLFPLFKKNALEDYLALAHSLETTIDKAEKLKNGDVISIKTTFDEELAKKLHTSINNADISVTVEDLKEGHFISKDQLFQDLKFKIKGISPVITVDLKNDSKDEFISTVNFSIENAKDFYENGDVIIVNALFDKDAAIDSNLDIEKGELRKEYKIDGFESYVTSTSQVSQSILKASAEEGKTYFGDALDYGLRIFTEANLYPDFSKGYEFSDPELISAYVEVISDPSQASVSKPYNYLELCYNVYLSQPGGKGCKAEAIVSFSNLTLDKDGNCIVDYSTGKLFSASHNDSSIKKSLNEWFGKDYNVEKFEIIPE